MVQKKSRRKVKTGKSRLRVSKCLVSKRLVSKRKNRTGRNKTRKYRTRKYKSQKRIKLRKQTKRKKSRENEPGIITMLRNRLKHLNRVQKKYKKQRGGADKTATDIFTEFAQFFTKLRGAAVAQAAALGDKFTFAKFVEFVNLSIGIFIKLHKAFKELITMMEGRKWGTGNPEIGKSFREQVSVGDLRGDAHHFRKVFLGENSHPGRTRGVLGGYFEDEFIKCIVVVNKLGIGVPIKRVKVTDGQAKYAWWNHIFNPTKAQDVGLPLVDPSTALPDWTKKEDYFDIKVPDIGDGDNDANTNLHMPQFNDDVFVNQEITGDDLRAEAGGSEEDWWRDNLHIRHELYKVINKAMVEDTDRPNTPGTVRTILDDTDNVDHFNLGAALNLDNDGVSDDLFNNTKLMDIRKYQNPQGNAAGVDQTALTKEANDGKYKQYFNYYVVNVENTRDNNADPGARLKRTFDGGTGVDNFPDDKKRFIIYTNCIILYRIAARIIFKDIIEFMERFRKSCNSNEGAGSAAIVEDYTQRDNPLSDDEKDIVGKAQGMVE